MNCPSTYFYALSEFIYFYFLSSVKKKLTLTLVQWKKYGSKNEITVQKRRNEEESCEIGTDCWWCKTFLLKMNKQTFHFELLLMLVFVEIYSEHKTLQKKGHSLTFHILDQLKLFFSKLWPEINHWPKSTQRDLIFFHLTTQEALSKYDWERPDTLQIYMGIIISKAYLNLKINKSV